MSNQLMSRFYTLYMLLHQSLCLTGVPHKAFCPVNLLYLVLSSFFEKKKCYSELLVVLFLFFFNWPLNQQLHCRLTIQKITS